MGGASVGGSGVGSGVGANVVTGVGPGVGGDGVGGGEGDNVIDKSLWRNRDQYLESSFCMTLVASLLSSAKP